MKDREPRSLRTETSNRFAKAFLKALEKAPLVPLAITGAAGALAYESLTPQIVYAQEIPPQCRVSVVVERQIEDGQWVRQDSANNLPVSCSEKRAIYSNAAERGSIRVEQKLDPIVYVLWGFAGGATLVLIAIWLVPYN